MAKIKVHELAKELELQSKDILNFLQEKGIEAKAAQSSLEEDAAALVRNSLELQKRCLEQEVPFLKYTELAGRLVLWKKEDDMLWLLEAPSQALQQCLMDASAAIQAFKAKKKGSSRKSVERGLDF